MYWDISPLKKVWLGDNHYILAMGVGQLHLEMDLRGGKKGLIIICSMYYEPDVSRNLLSVSYLIKRGYSVNFNNNECHIFCKQDQELCGIAKEVDGLVKLLIVSPNQTTWTKSGYEASASAYVLCPLATQNASISGSVG